MFDPTFEYPNYDEDERLVVVKPEHTFFPKLEDINPSVPKIRKTSTKTSPKTSTNTLTNRDITKHMLQSNGEDDAKPKRSRTAFKAYQLSALEKKFAQQQYIAKDKRYEFATRLDLTDRQVKIWFQNRRMKTKNQRKANSISDQSECSSIVSESSINSNPVNGIDNPNAFRCQIGEASSLFNRRVKTNQQARGKGNSKSDPSECASITSESSMNSIPVNEITEKNRSESFPPNMHLSAYNNGVMNRNVSETPVNSNPANTIDKSLNEYYLPNMYSINNVNSNGVNNYGNQTPYGYHNSYGNFDSNFGYNWNSNCDPFFDPYAGYGFGNNFDKVYNSNTYPNQPQISNNAHNNPINVDYNNFYRQYVGPMPFGENTGSNLNDSIEGMQRF